MQGVRGPSQAEREAQIAWILKGSGTEFKGWLYKFRGYHSVVECRCHCGRDYRMAFPVMVHNHYSECFYCIRGK